MIGASKILTVSYGTFSCTLEGFDDPFNTMKAIAEYFRDLAAEDRYFGAEPPTPDAAMLHKIAEREIHRRVEAKIQDNGVILRAGDDLAPEAPVAPRAGLAAPLAAPQTAPAAFTVPAPQTAIPVAAVLPAATLVNPEPAAIDVAISDSVAAKLLRIRNAVAQAAPVAAPVPAPDFGLADSGLADSDYSEDQHAGDLSEPVDFADTGFDLDAEPDLQPVALPEEDAAQLQAMLAADEALPEDFAADDAAQAAADFPAEAEVVAVTTAPDLSEAEAIDQPVEAEALPPVEALAQDSTADAAPADDDAALLASLGAQLAPAETQPLAKAGEFTGDLTEADWPDDDMRDAGWPDESWPEDDLEADDATLDDLVAEAAETDDYAFEDYAPDDLGPDLAGAEDAVEPAAELRVAQDLAEVDLAADLTADEALTAEDAAGDDAPDAAIAAEDLDDLAALDAAPAAVAATEAAQDEAIEAAPETLPDQTAEADVEAETRPEISEKAQRARARVIKIRRAQPAPAAATPQAADALPALEPSAASIAAATAASLSAEAEADLQRELAEVEQETAPVVPTRPVLANRPARPTGSDRMDDTTSDAAVNRLIAQTNTEMAGPENRRRLSAIAHLKAAVIATIADRRSGGTPPPSEADRIDPYRSDLTRLVRPAAPPAGGERPAPLVLVSAQRIDRKPDAPTASAQASYDAASGPVRPRRISSGSNLAVQQEMVDDDLTDDDADADTEADANIFDDSKGFAEFAERLGAQGLPALLEAAAAYTACVQGRPHFSRPHLIRQISAVDPEAGYSREDSLRGFGTLLRSGKITKVKRGRFALAENSHFLSEARKLLG